MTLLTNRPRGELLLDLLLGALRVRDEPLNALAVELLGGCGEGPVQRLVQEAANATNRPGHRVRALHTLRRIGAVADLGPRLDLAVLARDKHPAVRAAAVELLTDLGQPEPARVPEADRTPALATRSHA